MAKSMTFKIMDNKAQKQEDGQFFDNEMLFSEVSSLADRGMISTSLMYNYKPSGEYIYTFLASKDSSLYASHGIDRVKIKTNKRIEYLDYLITMDSRISANESNIFNSEFNKDIALVTYRTEKGAKGLKRKGSDKKKLYHRDLSKFLIF